MQDTKLTHRNLRFGNCRDTSDELAEREIRKTIPFTISSRRIKYLGINLTKEVKDLYPKNYNTLMRDIKKDTNKWKSNL